MGRKRESVPCSGDDVRKRSPLEQAIAEKKDRRVRYNKRLAEKGLKVSTLPLREEYWPIVRALAADLNGCEGDFSKVVSNLQQRLRSL